MKSLLSIFKRAQKDCVFPEPKRACLVRRTDRPAHPPVFSPFCRRWEKREALAARRLEETQKAGGWEELRRILAFADSRERGERRVPAARERGARVPRAASDELFPELAALHGFNMEERGMRRGGRGE